jgi:hypothetical protein
LQNLYTNKCCLDDEGSSRIPKTGWTVDSHGLSPAPECTWIPSAVGGSNASNNNATAATAAARSRTMPTLLGNNNSTAGGVKPSPVSAAAPGNGNGNGNGTPSTSPRRGSPRGTARVNF